ncbi:MAG: response regulator [Calothrix sp. FI2-JRJ7]|jgi:PAS domain S-box-containing protein|nr:response regulator [Calothrix sp. FI2-JRJ7]
MKLLVVEDDTLLGQMLAAILSNLNYAVEVAKDGEQAWDLIECYSYDLILLDVLLPSLDGISLCRRIRDAGLQMPILLVTGCNDSHEKAVALNAGADDYVVKPFDSEELVARVHGLLRRGAVSSQPVLEHGDLRLYRVNCEVTYRNEILTLTPKEYALLELFMRNSKRLFSCGMILEQLWSYDDVPSEEAVRTHIKGLRQKFKAAGAKTDLIETVYGIGYRLKAVQKPKLFTANLKAKQKTLSSVAEIWQKYKGRVSEQVNILAQAGFALVNKNLDIELRDEALSEAHTLAGSLASFGFPEGSKIAAQLEKLLKVKSLDIDDVTKFGTLVKALQQAIEPSPLSTSVIEEVEEVEEVEDERAVARILVVDDDPKMLAVLETLLAPWGLQVFPLENPQNFYNTLQTVKPDLLILDIEMPQMSGIELCQQVRNDSDWGDLPILFLTVHNDAPIINQVFTVGADDFVSKPIIGPELVTRILNRLERNKLRRKHAQASLRHINCMLKAIQACNKLLLRAQNELDLLRDICNTLTAIGKYKSVWVGFVETEEPLSIVSVASSGNTERNNLLDVAIKAVTSAKTCLTKEENNIAVSIPLLWKQKAFGIINIFGEPDTFDTEFIKQLEQLTADLAYGIISLRREQERTNELVKVNESLQCELERRLQMQEALRNSQALFAGIVSIADDAIISIDSQQCITLFNSGAERIFGYPASEVLGQPLDLLLPQRYTKVHRRHVSEFEISPNQSRKMGERQEIYGKRKDGTEFPAEASISKLKLGNKTVYTVYLQDVSDRKQIERMKNEFISVVSHELRTPLTSIHGSLGMLASGLLKPDSQQSQRLLQIAADSTERLVRLINNILDIERIESGRVKMSKQTCNAADLITEAINVIQPLAEKAGIVLSVTKLSVNVWVDPDRIVRTLTNLLSNAIKFAKPDTIVWLEAIQQEKEVLFIVRDNGRGIPSDKLEIIFERFEQLDASDARQQDGTGLGLAICKSIIQQHNGNIWVESTLGEGSTFYFNIPLE